MTDMERSHAELRAAVRLAGGRIRKLNFGRRDKRLDSVAGAQDTPILTGRMLR